MYNYLCNWVRLFKIYIFTRGPVLAAKISPAGPIFAADRFFRYKPKFNPEQKPW